MEKFDFQGKFSLHYSLCCKENSSKPNLLWWSRSTLVHPTGNTANFLYRCTNLYLLSFVRHHFSCFPNIFGNYWKAFQSKKKGLTLLCRKSLHLLITKCNVAHCNYLYVLFAVTTMNKSMSVRFKKVDGVETASFLKLNAHISCILVLNELY